MTAGGLGLSNYFPQSPDLTQHSLFQAKAQLKTNSFLILRIYDNAQTEETK